MDCLGSKGRHKTKAEVNIAELEKSIPFYKLYKFSTPLDIFLLISGVILSIISGICTLYPTILFAYNSGAVVEYSADRDENSTSVESIESGKRLLATTNNLIIKMCVIAAGSIVCTHFSSYCFTKIALRQTHEMRKQFFKKILHQDMEWYDRTPSGDFATIIAQNIPKIEDGIGEKVSSVIFVLTIVLCGVAWALIKGWLLAIICIIVFPIQSFILFIISRLSEKLCKEEMNVYSIAGAKAEEVLRSIRTVILNNAQKKEAESYKIQTAKAQKYNINRCLFNALNEGFTYFLVNASMGIGLWFGITLVLDERNLPENFKSYKPGNMIGVFFAAFIAMWNFGTANQFWEVFGTAKGAADKVFNVLDRKITIKGNDVLCPSFNADIVFKNVSFAYPSRETVQVLKNINVEINFGKTIGLVGHSGAGKSTIVQLLQRFYIPTEGTITVNGVDLNEINRNHLRSNVGVVNQEPALFATTIEENIRFGKLNASFDEIVTAAEKANAHKFITNFPLGYQTIVGEGGTQLSGGQKQKIAIARALVKKPSLLILDEATSALDAASEMEVQEALDKISEDCTKIVVAHRLSTIRNADMIIVFDKGQIVEQGSHDQLMETEGVYYNMINCKGITELEIQEEAVEFLNQDDRRPECNSDHIEEELLIDSDEIEYKDINASEVISKIIKISASEWLELVCGCLATLLSGAIVIFYCILFGDIIAVLSIPDNEVASLKAKRLMLQFLGLGLIAGLSVSCRSYCFGRASEKLIFQLRNRMFSTMLKQNMSWFDRKENSVGALCATLSGDAASVQGIDGSKFGLILNTVFTFALFAIVSFSLEWRLALATLPIFILLLLSIYYASKVSQQPADVRLLKRSVKIAVEAINNIRTVKSLGCERVFYQKYLEELDRYKSIAMQKSHRRCFISGCSRGIKFYAYAIAMRYGAYLMTVNLTGVDVLFKITQIVESTAYAIGNAMAFSTNFQEGLSAATRIIAFLKQGSPTENFPGSSTHEWENCDVKYSNINFAYPSRPSVQVLNDFNLSVMQGKNIALVGSSGAGKSTIIKLLPRFYDPISGDLIINKDDIRLMDLNFLRSQLGIVSQDPNLFNRSIADNISYGVNDKEVSMQEIQEAAKVANIHDSIMKLPLGYNQIIGSKGEQLSGGERQRIAIARALMIKPKILLLDEATSALDTQNEKDVQKALDNARRGKTCITIAHRLTTIQDADAIGVIQDGQVVEFGTHEELLLKRGHYYDFYKLQSGRN